MRKDQIIKMLSDILNEVDYDIWKSYFVYSDGGDTVLNDEGEYVADISPLVDIVNKHLKKAKK